MPDHHFSNTIRSQKKFFDTTTSCFTEDDSSFAPKPGMLTVAQHVAHTAHVFEWFLEGAFSPTGMKTDFERMDNEARAFKSLAAARALLDKNCAAAIAFIESKSRADFAQPIVGAIMAGEPREAIFEGIADHTAHHRGALAVYARLLGKTPAMPYA